MPSSRWRYLKKKERLQNYKKKLVCTVDSANRQTLILYDESK
jgi:hypothetical protein